MAFKVKDYQDLIRLLQEHPEWRAELRRLLLTDELLELPYLIRELVDAQRHTEDRVSRVEEELVKLAEAQRRTEERASRLEEEMIKLAEAYRQLAEVVRELVESHKRLVERVDRLTDTVADIKGRVLERTYHDKAGAYFGPLLRRLQVVDPYALEDKLRPPLSDEEFYDLLQLDLLLRGQPRARPEISELWLTVEVSTGLDQGDVERAQRRAAVLRRAGYLALPVVAGDRLTQGAQEEVRRRHIAVVQDGMVSYWEDALQTWAGT
jgi:hypothetical protein